MTTENEAFEKWLSQDDGVVRLGLELTETYIENARDGWNAAKADSEQRIAELEAEVKAYQDEQVAYTMKVVVERTELQAHINRLREQLEKAIQCIENTGDRYGFSLNLAKLILAETSAQSLKAYDDELIDKCVQSIINVGGKRV